MTDWVNTCVPTTLNPAGCAANLSGFLQSEIFTDDEISYENSWNLSLSYTRCSLRSKNPVVFSQVAADVLIGDTTKLASALSYAWIWPNAADSSPNTGSPITKSPSISSTLTTLPLASQFLIIPYAVYDVVEAP